ncbi:MAG: glycoside hydrolase family 97 protein [Saprospiraceae bacterium]
MIQKVSFTNLIFFVFIQLIIGGESKPVITTLSNIRLTFKLNKSGSPQYAVDFKNQSVIKPSILGFHINDSTYLDKNFQIIRMDSSTVDNTWKPVWGEVSQIRNHYKQFTVHLIQNSKPSFLINIIFRVFEDGVGFRYEFPSQPHLTYFIVNDELTQFNLTGDHKTFWIPGDYDSNEYEYTTSKLSQIDNSKIKLISFGTRERSEPDKYAVQTPLMMKTDEGLYINIHEAALVNYSSMQLHVNKKSHSLTCNLVPDAIGNKAYLRTPAKTPWRTIIVSDKATDILASKMILNLNEPSTIKNTAWIKPMKYIGVWWELQTGLRSWTYTNHLDSLTEDGHLVPHGHHGANTANVKKYIDFAYKNDIDGLLVEGWNIGWEEWIFNWNGGHYDFVTPYPDFDVKAVETYAKKKGVQMIMHNETAADASTYDIQMDTAFKFMNRYGYKAVKTGYVGNIIPRGEHHDGQWMINHYIRSIEKASDHHIMIDIHEPVRPTGLSRTYPNFMACEAARGNEWHAFSTGNHVDHETILPFTRLMGGPMDYTPGIFKLRNYAKDHPERQMHSTLAKQLALYVTMYSPLQMAADLPENYEAHMDAFQFIKDVAVDWDDTKNVEAEPGDYITIARKEKGKNNWFVGAITDENSRTSSVPLSFLDVDKKYIVVIYGDGDNANWKNNPEAYKIEKYIVTNSSTLKLKLAEGGGAAVSIMPATADQVKQLKVYP